MKKYNTQPEKARSGEKSLATASETCYKKNMKRLLLIAALGIFLPSCAHVISKETREGTLDVPFGSIRGNIEKYKGSTVIWGGMIANITVVDEGTELEVLQNPLDRYGAIDDPDISGGRFIAIYGGRLDRLIYREGREVTVAGKLAGSIERALDGRPYAYPVVEVIEIRLWKEDVYYPMPPYYYYPWQWYYPPYYYPSRYPPYYPPP